MKKVTWQRFEYEARVRNKRTLRNLESKAKRARLTSHLGRGRAVTKQAPQIISGTLRLSAPAKFDLISPPSRLELLSLVQALRRRVAEGERVHVDFDATRNMFPSGTLFILAELDRLEQLTQRKDLVSANYPRDKVVEQVLQQVGIMKFLGLASRQPPDQFPENVRHWHFAKGDEVSGEKMNPIVERYKGTLAKPLTTGLYNSVIEAMTNCVQHAYAWARPDGVSENSSRRLRNWWMFSQERDSKLDVALCDLGVGIPESLVKSPEWATSLRLILERVGGRVAGRRDASLIEAALELSRARSGEPHRGKGLQEVREVVRAHQAGHLGILSNSGLYIYSGQTDKVKLRAYGTSILGTMIQWTIPLSDGSANADVAND